MTRRRLFADFVIGALLGLGAMGQVLSDQLYRWVDHDGVTHFSDAPPPSHATAVQSTTRPEFTAVAPDNYYSIINQSRRLEQLRFEREQARVAEELARAERQRALAEAERAAAEARLAGTRSTYPGASSVSAGSYLVPYALPRHGHGHRRPPDLRPGHAAVERTVIEPRFEMQYGQRRFTGVERTTVTRNLGKP